MLVHTLAENGRPDDGTMFLLPRLASVLNTSAIVDASGMDGMTCEASDCAALASFSMCLWMNVFLKMPASAVFSYYISAYVHNALLFREWRVGPLPHYCPGLGGVRLSVHSSPTFISAC
ncbi:hypothetical protein E2C01_008977 [Portunus trituberculatus]|uniref:Uncharacterized protein n=1 Tax=Portunus trituberculatus TaxID=210409 RepID=A0A5B7D3Q8_PORTR|nr:hypothetical protein [Portunus trituberculatus]